MQHAVASLLRPGAALAALACGRRPPPASTPLRGPTPIDRDHPAAAAGQRGQRRRAAPRNYDMQPPTIPHRDRRLPDRQELQQVPGLPRARQDRGLAGRSRSAPRTTWTATARCSPQISTAALLLHAVPRGAGRRRSRWSATASRTSTRSSQAAGRRATSREAEPCDDRPPAGATGPSSAARARTSAWAS